MLESVSLPRRVLITALTAAGLAVCLALPASAAAPRQVAPDCDTTTTVVVSSTTTEPVEETTTTGPNDTTTTTGPNDTTTTETIRTTTTSPNDTTTTFPIPQFRQSPRQVLADDDDGCPTTTVVDSTEPADTDSSAPADSDSSAPAVADDGELSNDVTQPAGAAPALARTGSNILPFAAVGAMLLLIGAAFVRKARATS